MKAGAGDYVTKPFEMGTLLSAPVKHRSAGSARKFTAKQPYEAPAMKPRRLKSSVP